LIVLLTLFTAKLVREVSGVLTRSSRGVRMWMWNVDTKQQYYSSVHYKHSGCIVSWYSISIHRVSV